MYLPMIFLLQLFLLEPTPNKLVVGEEATEHGVDGVQEDRVKF